MLGDRFELALASGESPPYEVGRCAKYFRIHLAKRLIKVYSRATRAVTTSPRSAR